MSWCQEVDKSIIIIIISGLSGLIVGSFLNVVIYRLPLMLQNSWRQQCLEYLKQTTDKPIKKFNLLIPRSYCPHCQKKIQLWHNIPLLSFIILKSKCVFCNHKISWRYPVVEIASGLLTIFIVWHFGITLQAGAALIFTWALLALIFIDLEHHLLPDEITLGLLWLGLILSLLNVFTTPSDAIIGALAGYISFWIIGWLFKKIRGVEALGQGDYKLLAALGAWTGWQMLLFIVLFASVAGSIIGLTLIILKKMRWRTPIPFGSYLGIAGWICLVFEEFIINIYLRWFGNLQ